MDAPLEPCRNEAKLAAGRSARVLVVEDDADIGQVMVALIRHCGHDPLLAADGLTALGLAREFRPDVALLDIGLPGMNGYELAMRLRRESGLERTRFVALTGYGDDSDRQLSEQAGFEHHLVKPVTFEILQRILAESNAGATAD